MTHDHKKPRQYGDQMQCSHCGKAWDVNDPEPPKCTEGCEPRTLQRLQRPRRVRRKHGLK